MPPRCGSFDHSRASQPESRESAAGATSLALSTQGCGVEAPVNIRSAMFECQVAAFPPSEIEFVGRRRPCGVADPSLCGALKRVKPAHLKLPATVFEMQSSWCTGRRGAHQCSLSPSSGAKMSTRHGRRASPLHGVTSTLLERHDVGLSPVRRSKNRRSGSGTIARRSAASSHAAHRRGSCPGLPGCLSLTAAHAARSAASASWMVSVRLCLEFCFTHRSLFDVAQACLCGNTQTRGLAGPLENRPPVS